MPDGVIAVVLDVWRGHPQRADTRSHASPHGSSPDTHVWPGWGLSGVPTNLLNRVLVDLAVFASRGVGIHQRPFTLFVVVGPETVAEFVGNNLELFDRIINLLHDAKLAGDTHCLTLNVLARFVAGAVL